MRSDDSAKMRDQGRGDDRLLERVCRGGFILIVMSMLAGAPAATAAEPAAPPQRDIQDSILYFLLVDRFEDGDSSNNTGGYPAAAGSAVHGYNPNNWVFYHGGDLMGIEQRLDYLQGLGVDKLWLTPVFVNKPVQGSGSQTSAGFHGYWITDFLNVDPHLGSNADLERLVGKLGERGMGLFLDIVTNHTADVIRFAENQYTYRPLSQPPYTPVVPAAEANRKNPAWLNDPQFYHNRGDSTFSGESSVYGDFFGLDDLATGDPRVVAGMIEIYAEWIRRLPLAGFRIDTVKHVHVDFWREFAPAMRAAAEAHGRQDFFQFGEVWTGDARLLSEFSTYGEVDATLDFGFAYAARRFFSQSGAAGDLAAFFAADDWYRDPWRSAHLQPTFLENHDGGMGRWTWFMRTDNPGMGEAQQLRLFQMAHAFLLFARGVPVLYYGSEQGFAGGGEPDARARESMFPSRIAAYNSINLLGTSRTTADSNFDTNHPLYRAIATMAGVYREHRALRRGAQGIRMAAGNEGFAFARIDREELVEYIVVFNNHRTQSRSWQIPTKSPDNRFHLVLDLERGRVAHGAETVATGPDGLLTVSLPALSYRVYRAERSLPEVAEPLHIAFTHLRDGAGIGFAPLVRDWQRFPGRAEVAVEVTGLDHGEVAFYYRRSGAPDKWQLIAVDDDAPYRVFFRKPADLAADETLDFRAVASDLRNRKATAEVSGLRNRSLDHWLVHLHVPDGNFSGWQLSVAGGGLRGADRQTAAFIGVTGPRERFAFVPIADPTQPVQFELLGPGGSRPLGNPVVAVPAVNPEVFVRSDANRFFTSLAAALRQIEFRVKGPLASGAAALRVEQQQPGSETVSYAAIAPATTDDYGLVFRMDPASGQARLRWDLPFQLRLSVNGEPDRHVRIDPRDAAQFWFDRQREALFLSQAAAENTVVLHYHRPDGDYGNYSSSIFQNFWGLHVWEGAAQPNPSWDRPLKPTATGPFGVTFRVPLTPEAPVLAYILHRGDTKDPGPDQFLDVATFGHEVWQLAGADPDNPYLWVRASGFFRGRSASAQAARDSLAPEWVVPDRIQINALPGIWHQLQHSTDLRQWQSVGDPFLGSGQRDSLPLQQSGGQQNFYRVIVSE